MAIMSNVFVLKNSFPLFLAFNKSVSFFMPRERRSCQRRSRHRGQAGPGFLQFETRLPVVAFPSLFLPSLKLFFLFYYFCFVRGIWRAARGVPWLLLLVAALNFGGCKKNIRGCTAAVGGVVDERAGGRQRALRRRAG